MVPESPLDEVTVSVWGKDGTYDVFIGEAVIPLLSLAHQQEVSATFSLSKRRSDAPDMSVSGDVSLRLQLPSFPSSWRSVYDGVEAYERGDFPKAIASFSDALRSFPDLPALWGFRAAARTDALQYGAAESDARRVIELQPNRAEGHLRMGNVYVAADDFERAKECFVVALKLEPDHELTVEALREMDRKKKLAHLKRVIQMGREAYEKGATEAAVQCFTEAMTLNPKNVSYLVYRTLVLAASPGRQAEAMDQAQRIVQVDSSYPRDNPILTGYMQKQGQGLSTSWKSRYFILKERFLWYYKLHTDIFPIDLVLLVNFKAYPAKKSEVKFILELPRRKYNLRCASKQERDAWVDMLSSIAAQSVTIPHDEKERLVFFRDTSVLTPMKQQQSTASLRSISLVGVTHSGFLYKAGRINTAAKIRWFVVKDKVLYYFQKKETSREAAYYGSIPLLGTQLSVTDSTSFALIAPDRVWNLRAESPEECNVWISILRQQLFGDVATMEEDDNPELLRLKNEAKEKFNSSRQLNTAGAGAGAGRSGTVATKPSSFSHRSSVAIVVPVSGTQVNMNNNTNNNNSSDQHERGSVGSFGEMLEPTMSSSVESRSSSVPRHATSATSERRYFERLGLPIPEESDSEAGAASDSLTRIRDSDLELDYPGSDVEERASLLGNVVAPSPSSRVSNQNNGGVASKDYEDDGEEEKDCCCTIL